MVLIIRLREDKLVSGLMSSVLERAVSLALASACSLSSMPSWPGVQNILKHVGYVACEMRAFKVLMMYWFDLQFVGLWIARIAD